VSVVDDMVLVPAGPFCMGCRPDFVDECVQHELPLHRVELSGFRLDRTEVTQWAYAACVEAGSCEAPAGTCQSAWDPKGGADHPVACVSFAMAVAYCAFVGKRLPTEAEWEKAARGADGRRFPWGDEAADCERANFTPAPDMACAAGAEAVGSRPHGASPYGALDLAGNLWERVADWYDPFAYRGPSGPDPAGPATGSSRVLRGGAFTSPAGYIRATVRDGAFEPKLAAENLGFRCAADEP
jgi:formylglycine-generating enzyme required for sulfatase activity